MKTPTWLLVYLLLRFNISTSDTSEVQFKVIVRNSVTPVPDQNYTTYVKEYGILQGGLSRLQSSGKNFNFTYELNPDFGPYLLSVNGLHEDKRKQLFWLLLVKNSNGTKFPSVGIGCFTPRTGDEVILKYQKINPHDHEDL